MRRNLKVGVEWCKLTVTDTKLCTEMRHGVKRDFNLKRLIRVASAH